MKNQVLIFFLTSLIYLSCQNPNKIFEVNAQELPFTFNNQIPLYKTEGVYIDSTLFMDTTFDNLKKGRLQSLAMISLNKSYKTLFIKEDPPKWNDRFFLVNFDRNDMPFSYMYIYEEGYEVYEVKITKDTIYKYLDYNGDIWVEKTLIDKDGQFVFLGEEDYDPN